MSMNVNQDSAGRVLRFEITERLPTIFGSESFGRVGQYERLTGWAHLDLDPLHPLNAGISNLEFAQRETDGRVRYKVDVCIIRPMDLDRGNGWLFYEVVNRGTKRALQRINGARPNNLPAEREDIGTGFLLRNGFTIAWSGWQGDLIREPGRMLADLPVARRLDGPITAQVREEFVLEARNTVREDINEPIVEISEDVFIAPLHYPTADHNPAGKTLTVRARQVDPRVTPPGLSWRFVDERHIEICKAPGFDRSALYEFIYEAKDPIVLGAGLAGIRDINAFLRYETADAAGNPNPLLRRDGTPLPYVMGFGLSQSGRVLRQCLYNGWNRDAQRRRIFDGVITFVTGSRRGVIAPPFVHVTRYSRQHEDHLYPGDQFPFTFARINDPISGKTEGILDEVVADSVAPKIIHVDTDSEIWSGRSSLVVTDCEGTICLRRTTPASTFATACLMVRSAFPRSSPPCRPISYLITLSLAPRSRRCGPGSRMGLNRRPAVFPYALPGRSFPTRRRRLCSRRYLASSFQSVQRAPNSGLFVEPPVEGDAYPVS